MSFIAKGKYGLLNIGNTCYMNSALQSLLHTKEIVDLFLDFDMQTLNKLTKEDDQDIISRKELFSQFIILIKRMWNNNNEDEGSRLNRGILNISTLKNAFSNIYYDFDNFLQHDSHEFLTYLLDSLHQTINRVENKYNQIACTIDEIIPLSKTLSTAYYNSHKKVNDSHIIDLFYGQLKSTTKCLSCKQSFYSFDPFSSLGLSLPHEYRLFIYIIRKSKSYKIFLNVNEEMYYKEIRSEIETNLNEELSKDIIIYFVLNNKVTKIAENNSKIGFLSNRSELVFIIENLVIDNKNKQIRKNTMEEENNFYFSYSYGFEIECINTKNEIAEENIKFLSYPRVQAVKGKYLILDIKNFIKEITKFLISANDNSKNIEFSLLIKSNLIITKSTYLEEYSNTVNKQEYICLICNKIKSFSFYCNCIESNSLNNQLTIDEVIVVNQIENPLEFLIQCNNKHQINYLSLNICSNLSFNMSRSLKKVLQIEDLLNQFTSEETLHNYFCNSCEKKVNALKKLEINRFPKILIFQLKRFTFKAVQGKKGIQSNQIVGEKNENLINFQTTINLEKYAAKHTFQSTNSLLYHNVENKNVSGFDYNLYSICNHSGKLHSGHYTSISQHHITKEWLEFDDKQVKLYKDDLVSTKAYLLFYSKINE